MNLRIFPTPTERLGSLSLWVKRDDLTNPLYGGNKPRKLRLILQDARMQGAERLVTMGAAGSHHVLATAIFGRSEGFRVGAVLVRQPRTAHAVEVLRASLGQGLEPIPVAGPAQALRALPRLRGAYLIPLGGSNLAGAVAYAEAVRELKEAIERGELPEPDQIVVAAGSGGTAAGLAAGVVREGLRCQVVGVAVSYPVVGIRAMVGAMAWRLAWRMGLPATTVLRRLRIDGDFVGEGYGHPLPRADDAVRVATEAGLKLDPTYTSKTFAAALALAPRGKVLYWHTLSSAPMAPLLEGAPREEDVPAELRALLV